MLHITTCWKCNARKRALRKERAVKKDKGANKENESPQNVSASNKETSVDPQLSLLSLTDFLSVIEDQHTSLKLEANINLGTLSGANHREMADGLAYHVWEAMNLQFV